MSRNVRFVPQADMLATTALLCCVSSPDFLTRPNVIIEGILWLTGSTRLDQTTSY